MVTQADWYDPELNPKIAAFCAHYGTVMLPTKPYTPRHKGKIEKRHQVWSSTTRLKITVSNRWPRRMNISLIGKAVSLICASTARRRSRYGTSSKRLSGPRCCRCPPSAFLTFPADDELRSFLDARLDVLLHALVLLCAGQWTEVFRHDQTRSRNAGACPLLR